MLILTVIVGGKDFDRQRIEQSLIIVRLFEVEPAMIR
jgi:hypothetical protein